MSALVSYLGALGTSAANVPATHTAQPHTAPPPLRAVRPGVSPTTATAAVSIAAGQEIFETHACSACHGAAGPEPHAHRRWPLWSLICRIPNWQGCYAIQTEKCVQEACLRWATPEQEKSVIAYLRSLSPASPAIAQQQVEPPAPSAPRNSERPSPCATSCQRRHNGSSGCRAKRSVSNGKYRLVEGRYLWPTAVPRAMGRTPGGHPLLRRLSESAKKRPGPQLPNLLRHPEKRMRDGGMPAVNVDDAHLQLLVSYLSGLGSNPAAPSPGMQPAAAPSFPQTRQAGFLLRLPRLLRRRSR